MTVSQGTYELGWRCREAAPDIAMELFVAAHNGMGAALAQDLDRVDAGPSNSHERYALLMHPDEFDPNMAAPKPRPALCVPETDKYPHLADERILYVGAGAGSVIMAAYCAVRGANPKNITLVDPSGAVGGIWNTEWGRSGGYNNPKELVFSNSDQLPVKGPRHGAWMRHYIRGIAEHYLEDAPLVQGTITNLQRTRRGHWQAQVNGGEHALDADAVMLGTGAPHPRRIDGARFFSNLDEVARTVRPDQLILERFQRTLTDAELRSGRPFVFIGLGNSTAAMIAQIQNYEDIYQVKVPYYIATDYPQTSLDYPRQAHAGWKSVFRDPPHGYLTGYSGDLKRDFLSYHRALQEGRIIPSVRELRFDPGTSYLSLRGPVRRTIPEPHVFGLIGTHRDARLFRAAGALSRGVLRRERSAPCIRSSDGAVYTHRDGFMSQLYVAGAASTAPNNPNSGVIPGIQAQAPATLLTMAVRRLAQQMQVY